MGMEAKAGLMVVAWSSKVAINDQGESGQARASNCVPPFALFDNAPARSPLFPYTFTPTLSDKMSIQLEPSSQLG